MKASIENLARPSALDGFDNPQFRAMLEDHLTWLINHEQTTVIPVTAHQIDVYDYDWIGLLQILNVPADLHWITIRMNGGMSLTDVPQDLRSLRVPDYNTVQKLIALNGSSKRIK